MFVCQHCGASIALSEPVPRDAECSGCGRDLRACIQCRHYDPTRNNACRETEWIESQGKSKTDYVFAIVVKDEERLIGSAGLHQIDARTRSATFGLLIGDVAYQNRGFGSEAEPRTHPGIGQARVGGAGRPRRARPGRLDDPAAIA